MNKISYIFLPALILSACASDEESGALLLNCDDEIAFFPSLRESTTRTTYDVAAEIPAAGFTVSAICPEDDADENGILSIHCEDVIAMKETDGTFRSAGCKWSGNRAQKDGLLKFFAFHPSRSEMKQRAGVGDDCFIYSNLTRKGADGVSYDYRLTKFRVAPDISRQVDFVTAIGEGNKSANIYSGIQLDFEHQMCGVEIKVMGAPSLYEVEIAGVRIGGTVVEADFNLAAEHRSAEGKDNSIGSWVISDSSPRGHVDYVFASGDNVVTINATEHNSKEKAVSIMGKGGKAMIIPHKHEKWNHTEDKRNDADGTYFSVLLRMTKRDDATHLEFPSTDPESEDYLVYLSVRKSDGRVMQRLDKNGYIYGTNTKYNIPSTEEKREYGWAAVPTAVDWKAGYTYSYVLDYSKGVGVHDPADGNPASTIVDGNGVGVSSPELWEYVEISYDSLELPRDSEDSWWDNE